MPGTLYWRVHYPIYNNNLQPSPPLHGAAGALFHQYNHRLISCSTLGQRPGALQDREMAQSSGCQAVKPLGGQAVRPATVSPPRTYHRLILRPCKNFTRILSPPHPTTI